LEPLNGSCPCCGVVLEEDPFSEIPDSPQATTESKQLTDGGDGVEHSPPANPNTRRSAKPNSPNTIAEEDRARDGAKIDGDGSKEYDAWVEECVQHACLSIPNLEVVLRRSISAGMQIKFQLGKEMVSVNLYETGTVNVGGRPGAALTGQLKNLGWPPYAWQRSSTGSINRTFYILDVSEESLRSALSKVANLVLRELEPGEYMLFAWELLRGPDRLRLHAYTSEKVTLQGKLTDFGREVESALEAEMVRSHLEYRVKSSPGASGSERDVAIEEELITSAGHLVWQMPLPRRDTWIFVLEQLKTTHRSLSDYLCFVTMLAPALEEFLIEFAKRTKIGEIVDARGQARVGHWLTQFEAFARTQNNKRAHSLLDRLRAAWESRNQAVHPTAQKRALGADACREEVFKWLELMRDSMEWLMSYGTS
jgi:hypothetical protein